MGIRALFFALPLFISAAGVDAQESALACVNRTFRPDRQVATCQSGELIRAITCHGAYCRAVTIECCRPIEANWILDDATPSKPFPDRNKLAGRTDGGFVSGLMRLDDTLQLLLARGAGIENQRVRNRRLNEW